MPPKKGGKGGKKGKKKKGGDVDADAAFQEYLQEVFFIAPMTRDVQAVALKKKLRAAYDIFLNAPELSEGLVSVKDLPHVLQALGLNPDRRQMRLIQPLVEDSETGNWVVYEKLEGLLVQILINKELKYTTTTPEGVAQNHAELIYADSENVVMAGFDAIWQHQGGKRDQDGTKIIDAEPLRELLTGKGPAGEQFTDEEGDAMVQALSDGEMGYIKEDLFAQRTLGDDP
jgi:hypothetical protein